MRAHPGNFERNAEAVERLKQLAASRNSTVSQLALAWLLAQGDDIVPIPGTRSLERVVENAAAADVTLAQAGPDTIHNALPNGRSGWAERQAERWSRAVIAELTGWDGERFRVLEADRPAIACTLGA